MRLGEVLIREGVIDGRQLQLALQSQLMHGGHLGTCLMELGCLHELQLGTVLERVSGVPYAAVEMFRRIPSSTINLLPATLAERHRAVPLAVEGNALRVAMVDPTHLGAIDEMAFASGCTIEPWIAPEARILQAMDRYYEIPRSPRFVALCRVLDGSWINRPRTARGKGRAGQVPRYEASPYLEDVRRQPPAGRSREEQKDPPRKERRAPRRRRRSPQARAVSHPDQGDGSPAPPISWRVLSEGSPCAADDEISELLCRAESAGEVAEAILAYASERMARCILFSVHSTEAVIWKSIGVQLDQERVKGLVFPVSSEPIFSLFLGDGYYRGTLPDDKRFHSFYQKLGFERPARILLLPVYLDDRLVALFYGDGRRSDDIEGDTGHYRILLRKLALALDLVNLKRKIRAL